jgi:signal transduction histidine kinase
MMRGGKTLVWVVAGLITASIPIVIALNGGAGSYRSDVGTVVLGCLAGVTSLVVGLLLALRRPLNPIGWLLLGNAAVLVISGLAEAYAGYGLNHGDDHTGVRLAAAWVTWGWPLQFAVVVAIAFVFPDGRLPSPRWRPAIVFGGLSFLIALIAGMLWDEPLDAPFEQLEPVGLLPAGVASALHTLGLVGMIATLVLAVVAIRSRLRGADRVLRSQIKWVAYAAVLIPVAIIAGTVEGVVFDRDPGLVTWIPFVAAIVALPVAIGIAVLHYRLYEIDRLISATLVYGVLTTLLAATFAAVVLTGGVAIGGGSTLPTAAATLAVAIAFRPLRGWVQDAVDRRFNRARYEGLHRVDRFLDDLRAGRIEPEGLGAVLAEAVSDPSLRLFFWLPRDDAHADAEGRAFPALPTVPAGRTPVRRGDLKLGTLVHDPHLGERQQLLDAVTVRAGLAIEIARLRVEVRRQLAEVEASRSRIVTATYEERRRLERDIHDGAQQRLVSIGLDLRHLQRDLDPGASSLKTDLDAVVAGLGDAIDELRELARGVRPAALDGGIAPALTELASRSPVRTDVDATDERFGEEIEAAAYFVASEALANAVKHAEGSRVVLRASRRDGSLVVSVTDDGRGGATPAGGSGLTGLADRVAALGGRIELESDGSGTSLTAEFPCE